MKKGDLHFDNESNIPTSFINYNENDYDLQFVFANHLILIFCLMSQENWGLDDFERRNNHLKACLCYDIKLRQMRLI